MSLTTNFHYLLKYIIIGDSYVGKSNLLLKYVHQQFKDDFQTTIGVEFGCKNINIGDKIYRIQIWDTAGQENFRSITRAYYKNSVCAIVVYDITNKETFNSVQTWIEDCRDQSPETIFMILVGNKCDLNKDRVISYQQGKELADRNHMLFFETSAKTGSNVEELFETTAKKIVEKMEKGYYDLNNESCGIKKGMVQTNFNLEGGDLKEKDKSLCC